MAPPKIEGPDAEVDRFEPSKSHSLGGGIENRSHAPQVRFSRNSTPPPARLMRARRIPRSTDRMGRYDLRARIWRRMMIFQFEDCYVDVDDLAAEVESFRRVCRARSLRVAAA